MSNKLLNFGRVSEEVLYPLEPEIVQICSKDVIDLMEQANETARRRIRICAHASAADRLHEMLIVHEKNSYIRPHKHLNRSESFHIVHGIADIVIFNDEGTIAQVVQMGDFESGRSFFYRLNASLFHSMIIHSDQLIFHESTLGPFDPQSTLFAPWSPHPDETHLVDDFIQNINQMIENIQVEAEK